jgi:hypothetical protein
MLTTCNLLHFNVERILFKVEGLENLYTKTINSNSIRESADGVNGSWTLFPDAVGDFDDAKMP